MDGLDENTHLSGKLKPAFPRRRGTEECGNWRTRKREVLANYYTWVRQAVSDKRDPLQTLTQTVLLVVSLPALFREDRTEDDVSLSKEGWGSHREVTTRDAGSHAGSFQISEQPSPEHPHALQDIWWTAFSLFKSDLD